MTAYSQAVTLQAEDFAKKYGLEARRTYPAIASSTGMSIIHLRSEYKSTEELIKELSSVPEVISVSPNYVTYINPPPVTSALLVVGETKQLIVTGTDKNLTWQSSNPAIAAVNASGLVTGIAPGTVIITANTEDGGFSAATTVIVVPQIMVSPSAATVVIGETQQLIVIGTDKNLAWISGNTNVATIDASGLVTGISAGTAIITVNTETGSTTYCTVTVIAKMPGELTLAPSSTSIQIGNTKQLWATIEPLDVIRNNDVTWSSSNTAVATVSTSGLVTGISAGSATITANTEDGFTADCEVTVTSKTDGNKDINSGGGGGCNVGYCNTLLLTVCLAYCLNNQQKKAK
jgi:uncharacterized protein YjdB